MPATPYFGKDTLAFLRALAKNNNRDWFKANQKRYEEAVRGPALRLIGDLAAPLSKISPQFVASVKPVGGSLFRIQRDTRFSGDKEPYKTWIGIRLAHARAKEFEGMTPVFYVHLQPGRCFAGGGLWHGSPESVKRVRDYLVANPTSWKAATRKPAFQREFAMGGEALSRPPRGYEADHPLIEDLKRKDFVAQAEFDDAQMLAPDLDRFLAGRFRAIAPMVDWLCGALDLQF